jgi:peptidoglycan/xylan/chitin deacetylase (PgdA/CDA1 family)
MAALLCVASLSQRLALGGPPPAPQRLLVWSHISLSGLSYPFAARPMFGRLTPTRLFRPLPAVAVPDPARGLDGYAGANAAYVPVFVYHQVAPVGWPLTHGPDTVTPPKLAQALAYLSRHHDPTLTPSQFLAYMQGRLRVPQGSVFLTFDNGLEGVWRFAYPLLKRYHAHATVFLIGGRTLAAHVDGVEAAYLTWPQVEKMYAGGLVAFESETFALHHHHQVRPGHTAPAVLPAWSGPDASTPEAEQAYVRSLAQDFMLQRAAFESHLHYAPDLLVWPFSMFTRIARRVAHAYGIRAAFVVQPGFAIPGITAVDRVPRNDVSFMNESLPAELKALAVIYRRDRRKASTGTAPGANT